MQPIPVCDVSAGVRALRGEIDAAIARTLDGGVFVQGEQVAALERELAAYLGVRECVGLSSGSDALVIGLRAMGVGPGDEVIVPAFTFVACAEAVLRAGAKPVLADIEPHTFTLDIAQVRALLSDRTRAIMPVHLYGRSAALDAVTELARSYGLGVLEDCAQALGGSHGAQKLGSIGDAAALSFFPTKTLGALGDGGALATNDVALAKRARQLAQHGASEKYSSDERGYNSRLDALQAAVLRVKLPHLDAAIQARRTAARRYHELLCDRTELTLPDPGAPGHAFNYYTLAMPASVREHVRRHLLARGVLTQVYYPEPLHRLPAYAGSARAGALEVSGQASRCVLSLPFWPEMDALVQLRVARELRAALDAL